MEGKGLKSFVVLVLVLSLLGQTQVQAIMSKWCCKNTRGKGFLQDCVSKGMDQPWCAVHSGCVPLDSCGGEYPVYAGKNHFTLAFHSVPFHILDMKLRGYVQTDRAFVIHLQVTLFLPWTMSYNQECARTQGDYFTSKWMKLAKVFPCLLQCSCPFILISCFLKKHFNKALCHDTTLSSKYAYLELCTTFV